MQPTQPLQAAQPGVSQQPGLASKEVGPVPGTLGRVIDLFSALDPLNLRTQPFLQGVAVALFACVGRFRDSCALSAACAFATRTRHWLIETPIP
jgi:hypothetical protein